MNENSVDLTGMIVDRLSGYLPFLEVASYPDSPDNYRFTHHLGACLVMYQASNGDANQRIRQFDVVAVSRAMLDSLRIIEAVRWILARWEPYPGAGRFECVHDSFMDEEEGVWWYGSRFTITGPPQHVKEEALETRIKQLFNII